MKKITIDPEFKAAIPLHRPEERDGLEADILADGKILSPGITWNGILVDGHNRYEIAQKHKLKFPTVEMKFGDREDVLIWILSHQLNRRNITDFARVEISLKLKDRLAAQAKKRQGRKPDENIVQNSAQCSGGRTRDAVAESAGVSHDTVDKVEKVIANATPAVADMARSGTISTDAAAQVSTLSKKEQKKLAAEGAKAVKAAAAAVRKAKKEEKAAEPERPDDAPPWYEFEQTMRGFQSELRSISSRLTKLLVFDPKTKRATHQWGLAFGHAATSGAINGIIGNLADGIPVEIDKKTQWGFRTKYQADLRKAAKRYA